MKQIVVFTLFAYLLSFLMSSCVSVKPYQKGKLNDAEMILSNRTIEKYQNNFLMYREGATGGNGSRTGGGCGCN